MTPTSAIEPVGNRFSLAVRATEKVIAEQVPVLRGRNVFCVDAAGSTNLRCVTIPDIAPWTRLDADELSMRTVAFYVPHQSLGMAWEPTLGNPQGSFSDRLVLLHTKPVESRLDFGNLPSAATANMISQDESVLPIVIQEFAPSTDDTRVVAMAARIVQAALEHTIGPEITVDDEDGIDFHLRLAGGLLVMANLFPDGTIDASVYDDSRDVPVKTLKRMRRGTTSEQDLLRLFRSGIHASATR